MLEVLVKYLHFLGIFGVVSALVAEHLLTKTQLTGPEVKRLAAIDAVYGISAVTVLAAGLSLWLWVGKPSAFYTDNPVFHIKVTAFLLVGLLSIYPTIFFIKHRKSSNPAITVPGKVIGLIRAELFILAFIPLLAILVARGYGLG